MIDYYRAETAPNDNAFPSFDYQNNAASQRTQRTDNAAVTNNFGYNIRQEVISATMGADNYGYGYDTIGNREWASLNLVTNLYTANNLNQYTSISALSASPREPLYDLDGNMIYDGAEWHYTWNGENRMICASNATYVVKYAYDHQGRMVWKRVATPDTPTETMTYLWDDYNIIAEKVGRTVPGEPPIVATTFNIWGFDLSGTLQGAGGVGGLLAVVDGNSAFLPCYDANGNITEYIATNGTITAHYEYSPFGEITAQSGDLASTFTHRFSTKPFDITTGKVLYAFRPYDPLFGRWLRRDPIGINGGFNVYGFVRNDAISRWDYLGLTECECAQERIWMELGEKMRAASLLTIKNPITIDANFDKAYSRIPALVNVYREYGGYICCNEKDGKVSSTGPYAGTWRYTSKDGKEFYSDNPLLLAKGGGTPTVGNITSDPDKQCPQGTTTILFYHSHPPNSPNLSPSDVRHSNAMGEPIVGGAAGADHYWVYSPSYGWILVEY